MFEKIRQIKIQVLRKPIDLKSRRFQVFYFIPIWVPLHLRTLSSMRVTNDFDNVVMSWYYNPSQSSELGYMITWLIWNFQHYNWYKKKSCLIVF